MGEKGKNTDIISMPSKKAIKKHNIRLTLIAALGTVLCLALCCVLIISLFPDFATKNATYGHAVESEAYLQNTFIPFQCAYTECLYDNMSEPCATVIQTAQQLADYCETCAEYYNIGSSAEAGSFMQIAAGYSESFFCDNMLVIIELKGDAMAYTPTDYSVDGSVVTVSLTYNGNNANTQKNGGHIFVELQKSDTAVKTAITEIN